MHLDRSITMLSCVGESHFTFRILNFRILNLKTLKLLQIIFHTEFSIHECHYPSSPTLIILCCADSTRRLVGGLGKATKQVSMKLLLRVQLIGQLDDLSLFYVFGFLWRQSILYFHTQRDIVQQCTMPEKYRTMCNVLQESKDENLKTSLRRVNSFFSGTATSSLEGQSTSYSDRYCLRKQFWWIMMMPADGGKVDTILLGACQLLEHL